MSINTDPPAEVMNALEGVYNEYGIEIFLLVRSVVRAKLTSTLIKKLLDDHVEDATVSSQLWDLITEVNSELIAATCSVLDKEFLKDIAPLVDKVLQETPKLQ